MIKLQRGGFTQHPVEGWPDVKYSVWTILEEVELDTTNINEIMKKAYELMWKKKWHNLIVKGDKFSFELMEIEVIDFMDEEKENEK